MAYEYRVPPLDRCQTYFLQFCRMKGLHESAIWKPHEFIIWCHQREEESRERSD